VSDFLSGARRELDILDGTLVPEFVQVQEGYYHFRAVATRPAAPAGFVRLDDPPSMDDLDRYEVRPCAPIPRFRTELRWVPAPTWRRG
jgi:hypothetical protein